MPDKTITTIIPTKAMIEAGAKAAYGTVFLSEEDWPEVSGSVAVDIYREAAERCFEAMMKVHNE